MSDGQNRREQLATLEAGSSFWESSSIYLLYGFICFGVSCNNSSMGLSFGGVHHIVKVPNVKTPACAFLPVSYMRFKSQIRLMSGKSPRAEDDPVVRGMRCVHMSHPWRTIGEPTAPGTIVYLRVRVGDGSLHVTGLGLMSKKEPNDFLSHDNIWTAESFQFLQVQLYISFQYGVIDIYIYIHIIYSILSIYNNLSSIFR